MIEAQQIREKFAAIARGEISIADFDSWFDVASWSMHRDSDAASIRLASRIHLAMADHDNGVLDDSAYLAVLASMLSVARISIQFDENLNPIQHQPYNVRQVWSSSRPQVAPVFVPQLV